MAHMHATVALAHCFGSCMVHLGIKRENNSTPRMPADGIDTQHTAPAIGASMGK